MTPDLSQWRQTATYTYIDHLTSPDIGWEWIRRNSDYQQDYAAFVRRTGEPGRLIERAQKIWGLRFPCKAIA